MASKTATFSPQLMNRREPIIEDTFYPMLDLPCGFVILQDPLVRGMQCPQLWRDEKRGPVMGMARRIGTGTPETREQLPYVHRYRVNKICRFETGNTQRSALSSRREINPSIQTHPATYPKPSSSHPHAQSPTLPHMSHRTQGSHPRKHPSTREPATISSRGESNPTFDQ